MSKFQFSIKRACKLLKIHRSAWYYKEHPRSDEHIRIMLKELANARPRFGYRRLMVLLWRKGMRVSKNLVYRIYKEEGLGIRHRKFKKRRSHMRVVPFPAQCANERWSIDFISDGLINGRKFRCFNVIDLYSRKLLGEEIDHRLPAIKVVKCLERIAKKVGGYPKVITLDNGPEFISEIMDDWATKNNVHLDFIRPGCPVENGFIESYHARMREECLELHRFRTIEEVRLIIRTWRQDYNSVRPHSSLKDKTPNEVWKMAQGKVDTERGTMILA